jgi:hypothetical protein
MGNIDSVFMAATGDGGSASDYRGYSSAANTAYPEGTNIYLSGGFRNNSASYYAVLSTNAAPAAQTSLFSQQGTGTPDAGEPAFRWHAGQILVKNNIATFSLSGLPIISVDLTTVTLGGSNIFFMQSDINAGSSLDPNDRSLLFGLIDNVRVSSIDPPVITPGFSNIVVEYATEVVYVTGTSANVSGSITWTNTAEGSWDPASGQSNWVADVYVIPGVNPIVFHATNAFGDYMATTVTIKRLTEINTSLTVYYDFEGDFLDAPGAGVTNDDLANIIGGVALTGDVPANALGSTMSYTFDNRSNVHQVVYTDAWSPDLASADQYTIMFWFKGDDMLQRQDNTRLISVREKANGSQAPHPAFQVEGFGANNPNGMDTRLQDPLLTSQVLWFSEDATGVLGNDGIASNDVWHHIVFTLSNRGREGYPNAHSETYVDGISLGKAGTQAGNRSNGNPIGNREGVLSIGGLVNNNRGATGFIDDFALFEGIVPSNVIYEIANGLRSPTNPLASSAISITPSATNSMGGVIYFTVVFSSFVTGFDGPSDIIITHSGTTNTGVNITGSNATYTVMLTGVGGAGSFTLAVNTGSDVQSLDGEPIDGSVTSATVNVDVVAPDLLTIAYTNENPTARRVIQFAAVFSEPVNGFAGDDVVINHTGTAHTNVSVVYDSGSTYLVNIQGVTGDGQLTVTISAGGGITDISGNALSMIATSAPVSHVEDAIPPNVLSIIPQMLYVPSTSNELYLSVLFDELVEGFDYYQDVIITDTNFDDNFNVCVGCLPGGGYGPTVSSNFSVSIGNFRVIDGFTNATMTVRISTTNGITDVAGNPLASSVTSAVIIISANVYQLWAMANGLTAGVNFDADMDLEPDGNNNASEFMRNTDPLSGNDVFVRRLVPHDINGTNYFTYTLPMPRGWTVDFDGAYMFLYDDNRGISAFEEYTSSENLLAGFPNGSSEITLVEPALDGPVTGYPDLPSLPATHEYRTIRLSTGTDVLPYGFIWLETYPYGE